MIDFLTGEMVVTQSHCSRLVSPTNEYLYRYDAYSSDEGSFNVTLSKFPIVRKTRCMDVIDWWGKEKYIDRSCRKRFAYPTRDLAWNSLQRRILKRVGHTWNAYETAQRLQTRFGKAHHTELKHDEDTL